ncbi:MAG: hypothetical protein PHS79_05545 [Patescibacteria group bacterium]|nr:hypothetical protein [Patescibacteria group bacterium]
MLYHSHEEIVMTTRTFGDLFAERRLRTSYTMPTVEEPPRSVSCDDNVASPLDLISGADAEPDEEMLEMLRRHRTLRGDRPLPRVVVHDPDDD